MYEKNFKKGSDLYEYCVKIEYFFSDKFGKFVSQHIWEIYQKKLRIEIKNIKTVNEFMDLSNTIIEEVFSKHKNNEEVESIKMEVNMGFYVSKVITQLQEILKEELSFKDINIRSVTKRYVTTHINSLEDLSILNYHINGVIKADLFLIFEKESLKNYIEEFVKILFREIEEQKEMLKNDMDLLTKEFCGILVNNFSDTIANTLKQTITPNEDENNNYYDFEKGKWKILNYLNKEDYIKIIKISTLFKYSIIESKIRMFFFINKSRNAISSNINKIKLEKEIPGDKREMEVKVIQDELFAFLKNYLDEINPSDFKGVILKNINKKFITEIKYKDIKESLIFIEDTYLKDKTIVTRRFIINGLNNIFEKLVEVNNKYSR